MLTDPDAKDETSNADVLDELVRVRRAIGSLAGAVKAEPAEAPIVNVPAPVVHVTAPDVNVSVPKHEPWCGTITAKMPDGREISYRCEPDSIKEV